MGFFFFLLFLMIVPFICQLDWAKGCPDIWSNIFLGVSVRVFLRLTFGSVNRVEQVSLPSMVGLI